MTGPTPPWRSLTCAPSAGRNMRTPRTGAFMPNPPPAPSAAPGSGWKKGDRRLEREPSPPRPELLQDGKIVAIKGLGGFHLAADAAP